MHKYGRWPERIATLLLTPLLLVATPGCRANSPSVLLITIDTLRPDRLGCYGYPLATSPNIDRLAREAVLFENAYCQIPKTNPSLVSLMTGLYPSTHKSLSNGLYLPDQYMTLAEILSGTDYATCGVIGQYNLARRTGIGQGFQSYFDEFPSNELVIRGGGRFDSFSEKRAAELVDIALNWLRSSKPGTFFLWIHFMDPHAPYDPPSPFDTALPASAYPQQQLELATIHLQAYCPPHQDLPYYLQRYDGEIRYVDEQIGRLMSGISGLGLDQSLITILTADHGEYMGDPDGPAARYFCHGETLTDGEIHVPLIWRVEGNEAGAGKRIHGLVEIVDVFPTLLQVLGMKAHECDGHSLARYLEETPQGPESSETTTCSYSFESNTFAVQQDHWKLVWQPTGRLADYFNKKAPFFTVERSGSYLIYDRSHIGPGLDPSPIDPAALSRLKTALFNRLRLPLDRRNLTRFPLSQPLNDPELIEHLKSLGYLQ